MNSSYNLLNRNIVLHLFPHTRHQSEGKRILFNFVIDFDECIDQHKLGEWFLHQLGSPVNKPCLRWCEGVELLIFANTIFLRSPTWMSSRTKSRFDEILRKLLQEKRNY